MGWFLNIEYYSFGRGEKLLEIGGVCRAAGAMPALSYAYSTCFMPVVRRFVSGRARSDADNNNTAIARLCGGVGMEMRMYSQVDEISWLDPF